MSEEKRNRPEIIWVEDAKRKSRDHKFYMTAHVASEVMEAFQALQKGDIIKAIDEVLDAENGLRILKRELIRALNNGEFAGIAEIVPNANKVVYEPGPKAFLFSCGTALYFDDSGKQMPELQELGISGLHEFLKRYKNGKVFWAVWEVGAWQIPKNGVENLLNFIKEPTGLKRE